MPTANHNHNTSMAASTTDFNPFLTGRNNNPGAALKQSAMTSTIETHQVGSSDQ